VCVPGDLLLAVRKPADVGYTVVFLHSSVSCFARRGPEPAVLRTWHRAYCGCGAVATMLSSAPVRADYADGTLEQLLEPQPLRAGFAKVMAHWVTTGPAAPCLKALLAIQLYLQSGFCSLLLACCSAHRS